MGNNSSVTPAGSLQGKVAIVTGSSRGIGRAIAIRLGREGAHVVLAARTEADLQETRKEIIQAGGTAEALALDLRKTESSSVLVAHTLEKFGAIDIVVNNAGATKRGNFLELTEEDWSDGYALKFFGAVRLTRAAWPSLTKAKGSVVFIAGIGGRTPGAPFTIGGSVNAALLSLTKALSDQGVSDGIQVNAINPGGVKTDRLRKRIEARAQELGVAPDEAAKQMIAENRVSRLGIPEDIAALVAFVVGSEGRWFQGALIDMDGGETKTL